MFFVFIIIQSSNIIRQYFMGIQTEALPWDIHVGSWTNFESINIRSKMEKIISLGFSWAIFPLFSDQQISSESLELDHCSIPCQQDFSNTNHLRKISLQINKCIDITTEKGREAFSFIIGYATYLGLYSIVMYMPDSNKLSDTIWELNKIIQTGIFGKMHIVWNVQYSEEKADSAWRDYIYLRNNISKRVYFDLMLCLSCNLPNQQKLLRWLPQRIDYITLPTNIFTTNNKGFPVLTYKHEQIVRKLFYHKTRIIIRSEESSQLSNYIKLIEFMVKQLKRKHETGHLALKHFDMLQSPLQPYSDNLQSETYVVFQMDNAKYDQYEIALTDAMNTFPKDYKIVIYYVGCGKGGLLFSCFSASKKTGRKIHVYAIDKNPFPLQTVKKRMTVNKWLKNVDLVCMDAKVWQPKQQADICLSQLLGAFGDNQLSPQCLSWAQKHIWKPGCDKFNKKTICIPQNYTAYITPLSYSSVYKSLNSTDRQNYFTVNIHNCYKPSNIQEIWTFSHPLPDDQTFERSSEKVFHFTQDCLVNGFAGFFTSDLYGRGRLSILPSDHTQEMQSWYPLFFSFKKQILVDDKCELHIGISRKSEPNRVWYQWSYRLFKQKQLLQESIVHNMKGSSHSINC